MSGKILLKSLFQLIRTNERNDSKMKETIRKEQSKMTLIYGTLFLVVGLIGTIFPESSRFIISFCFIFGGSSTLTGLFYFAGKKMNQPNKNK
ncbi:hypothetical protein [Aerococcus urinaeequi]|uniref:hypothetical protein n=1 Tax=Aerococcus urinaeequi TaxID=51665 RepID=UPI003AB0697B